MTANLTPTMAAALLAGACFTVTAHAGTLTLLDWAYGPAGTVKLTSPPAPSGNVRAGAFSGVVSGFAGDDAAFNGALITYCVELGQSAPAWNKATNSYEVVAAADYFGIGARGNELGSFMTYIGTASLFDADDDRGKNSGAVQLAVWNIVHDSDFSLAAGTLVVFHGLLPHGSAANRSPRSRMACTLHVPDGTAAYAADNWLQRSPALPVRGF